MRIASMTKPIVSVAVLMLVEEGKIRLDDPVSRFIPAFKDVKVAVPRGQSHYTVPVDRALTITDLLTHTGGLVSGPLSIAAAVKVMDRHRAEGIKALDDLATVPLEYQPGTRWSYSGLAGFELLARIVEIAAGQRFGEFAQQRIFAPLGMKDTTFWPTDAQRARMATLYVQGDKGITPNTDPDRLNTPMLDSGGGGLITTIESYGRFAMLLANGGEYEGVRLLAPSTVRLMGSRIIAETLPGRLPGEGYGLGVRVVTDAAARHTLLGQGSYGWSGAYGTHFWVDPARKLTAILFVQTPSQQRTGDFETAVMQAVLD
jgi:CubicO group peptidase (beta-lactamase class C family)